MNGITYSCHYINQTGFVKGTPDNGNVLLFRMTSIYVNNDSVIVLHSLHRAFYEFMGMI